MVYLLKWLISLITPHTHDKEGKQGNSFIVRKALGNRASFSSLASKKGSSLLLVVMTMSVIIVISSSFMLLSFNTGIGSIFASSQQKAQLSCLSVAEGLKDGNTFDKIVSYYDTRLRDDSTNHEAEFVANNDNLNGETKVKLKAEQILQQGDLNEKYREWVEANKDKVFTCEKDSTLPNDSKRVVLKEDESNPKWLFHVTDLELVM